MKGFHPTPSATVDAMVDALFRRRAPRDGDRLLDPGSGEGAFVDGVLRWCRERNCPAPEITALENDPELVDKLRRRFAGVRCVKVARRDFLRPYHERFEYIVGNPPYVGITGLSEDEKQFYRASFLCARGRFDLYMLFFEQALNCLAEGGWLAFVTPEKFMYVEAARTLRRALASRNLAEVRLLDESTFPGLVTYPNITILQNGRPAAKTSVTLRSGETVRVALPGYGDSWSACMQGHHAEPSGPTLSDVCTRISAGVATGADKVFVHRWEDLPTSLRRFAYPTVAGRQLGPRVRQLPRDEVMLVPYAQDGSLMPESDIRELIRYLSRPDLRWKLESRTCVTRNRSGRKWYAFHERPVMTEIQRPKLLCKDITANPFFVMDEQGDIVPRHSVYYIVPRHAELLKPLMRHLSSDESTAWLRANCQRAANGFLRLQSHVLKRLPIPASLLSLPEVSSENQAQYAVA